jgi:hypothetical protein
LGGCVERSLTIDSDPPGAAVFLDGESLGSSPVTVPFTFYGRREVLLRKVGYRNIRRIERVRAPWYQWFPLDLLSEAVWPGTIHDRRSFLYRLEPDGPEGGDLAR